MPPSLVIFLHSARYDRLYQAAGLLVTASGMGERCHLFLFFDALASYMAGNWDDVATVSPDAESAAWSGKLRRSMELAATPSLYQQLETARAETGGLTVCACSTSARFLGLDTAEVQSKVDAIVGLATMLEIAGDARTVLYI